MMITILNKVAEQRLKASSIDSDIQLSSYLMQQAVDDMNKIQGDDKPKISQNEMMNEFKLTMLGEEFTIKNRAYRDDTNDSDVEEVLYEVMCLQQQPNHSVFNSELATQILLKHIPSGCINLKSYKEEKEKILKVVQEYHESTEGSKKLKSND